MEQPRAHEPCDLVTWQVYMRTCSVEWLTQLSQKIFACIPSHPQNSSRLVLCGSSTAVSTASAHATGILHRHLTPRFVLVQNVPPLLVLPLVSSCSAHFPCSLSQCLLLSASSRSQAETAVSRTIHTCTWPGIKSRVFNHAV